MEPNCPECNSSTIETSELAGSNNPETGWMYMTVTCENGHEYGLELEVVTVLT
jgi:hypothetical protein